MKKKQTTEESVCNDKERQGVIKNKGRLSM